jgi:hypothetical protein
MASDYGLNFGFRRSDEVVRISEGRYRTPKTGTLLQGTAVEINFATPGYLKAAAAGARPRPGVCGLLVQELAHIQSIYDLPRVTSFDLNKTKPDALSVITNGPGVKVWFRNTPAQLRVDGRQIPAVTMVAGLGTLEPGDYLGWNGTAFAEVGTGPTGPIPDTAFGQVLTVNPSKGMVEVTLLS